MNINSYLIISPGKKSYNPNIKISKTLKTYIPADAVVLKLSLQIPDTIFKKPQLEATIKINESDVSKPVINAQVLHNIKTELSKNIGVDLTVNVVEEKKK